MATERQEGPLDELAEAGIVEPVLVREKGGRFRRAYRITRRTLLAILVIALVALVVAWSQRRSIADNALQKMFEEKGVRATYSIDRIGFRTQKVSNLVIGDPKDPDLFVRNAVIELRPTLTGKIDVYRIFARGVRLKGEFSNGKLRLGDVDKLSGPPSGKPFTLPDVAVDLADTTLALRTPYGPMGFALAGIGNLSGGFAGSLAASARRLTPGNCELDAFRARVGIRVEARRPHLKGPLTARRFTCVKSGLAIAAPSMLVDSDFSEAFEEMDGNGVLSFDSLASGPNRLGKSVSKLTFAGSPTRIDGKIDLAASAARLADIRADSTTLDGDYHLEAKAGVLTLRADYRALGVAMGPTLLGGLTDGLKAASGTPLGPIAAAMARAMLRATGDFDVDGALRVANLPGRGGVRIESADARARSGARIRVSGGDGVTYYWPDGTIRVDGNVETSGGGLPQATLSLSSPRGGGAMSGTLLMAPYQVGANRLALEPVRFLAGRDGSTFVETVARVDGPFKGGAVKGLVLPIRARFGGPGGFDLGNGCLDARFEAFRYGGLSMGRGAIPICPTKGRSVVRRLANGTLIIGATSRDLALRGQLGNAPFTLFANRFDLLDAKRFAGSGVRATIGDAAAPVRISADRVAGSVTANGAAGTFGGGSARIGNVPLLLSEASGTWADRPDGLIVEGGATVSDAVSPPRFYPLRSNDLRFVLAGNRIDATGSLRHPASGALVTNAVIQHDLSNGEGRATLDVPGIRFTPNGLQPSDITRLSEGVIALVDGLVRGQGRINWHRNGKVDSSGSFDIVDTDLAAPFGPVTGLNTTVEFTDLLGLETKPGGIATVASINPGILVENGQIRYRLLRDQKVLIEEGRWPFMGGTLVLRETVLDFSRPTAKRLTFEVIGLDAHTFVNSMGFKEIDAHGVFDGVLPMIFDENGGRIVGGRLDSRPPGGSLSYRGVINRANLGLMSKIAFDLLKDLKFRSMVIRIDGALDGEFVTRMNVEGVGLGTTGAARILKAINRVPINFNIRIKGPFRALIATAKSLRDPTVLIGDFIPLQDATNATYEVRRREEEQEMSQTPPGDTIILENKSPIPTKTVKDVLTQGESR